MQNIFRLEIFMIIDTHCHVYASEMENAEEIIRQAEENDMHLILNGTDPQSNGEILELAGRYDNVHAALGYYHTLAGRIGDDELSLLDSQLKNDNVIAVGEIGLDYYHTKDNRDTQKELFEEMLCLAEKHNLPVIVHSRKSIQDTYDMLKGHDITGSLHCYQGSAEMAREFVKLGFYIGIGGPITHTNNKKAARTVKQIDIASILVETDSPYLSPQEKRSEINTPLNLKYITKALAKNLYMEESDVVRITADNARNLFGI